MQKIWGWEEAQGLDTCALHAEGLPRASQGDAGGLQATPGWPF